MEKKIIIFKRRSPLNINSTQKQTTEHNAETTNDAGVKAKGREKKGSSKHNTTQEQFNLWLGILSIKFYYCGISNTWANDIGRVITRPTPFSISL